MEVLVHDRLPQPRQIRILMTRRIAEQGAVDDLRDLPVPFGVQVDALDRERRLARGVQLAARREQVDERHSMRLRDFPHGASVELEPLVVLAAVREIGAAEILVRDRREQHDPWGGLAVVSLGQRVLEPVGELLLERVDAGLPRVRLAVAEEGEDHVRSGVGAFEAVFLISADWLPFPAEPLVRRPEILRPEACRDFIAAEPEVADGELVLRKPRLQHRLQPAVVLQPLRQGIADDADVLFFAELEGGGRGAAALHRAHDRERHAARPPTRLSHAPMLQVLQVLPGGPCGPGFTSPAFRSSA